MYLFPLVPIPFFVKIQSLLQASERIYRNVGLSSWVRRRVIHRDLTVPPPITPSGPLSPTEGVGVDM